MGLRLGLDPNRLQDLADEPDLEAFAATTSRLRKANLSGKGPDYSHPTSAQAQ